MYFSRWFALLSAVIFLAIPLSAQTIDEAKQLLDYTSRFEAVQEEAYSVWLAVDDASLSVTQYQNGEIGLETVRSRIRKARQVVEAKTRSVQRLLDELPPAPSGTSPMHDRLKEYPKEASDLNAEGSIAANSFIDALEGSLSGDIEAVKQLDELALLRAQLLVGFANRSFERDIASIPTPDHPQIFVLRNAICTNNLGLLLGRLDFAFAYELQSEVTSLRGEIEQGLPDCRAIVRQGRRAQMSNLEEIETLRPNVTPEENEFILKLLVMMRSYDAAWDVEDGILHAMAELSTMYEKAPGYAEMEAQWARIYEYEEKRGELIFDRMSLLQ